MSEEKEKKPRNLPAVSIGQRGIELRTMDEGVRFASAVSESGLAPRGMKTPQQILVAIQTGMEAGLSPMKALNSVIVINGVPSWKGDAARALVNASGVLKPGTKVDAGVEGEGDEMVGYCETWRDGDPQPERTTFSVADAKMAQLWRKEGPWQQYPKRMLMYRALGFHLRDYFGDILLGLRIAEESADIPEQRREPINVTPRPTAHETPEMPSWAEGAVVRELSKPLPDPEFDAGEPAEAEAPLDQACGHKAQVSSVDGDDLVTTCTDCGEELRRSPRKPPEESEEAAAPPATPDPIDDPEVVEALATLSEAINKRADQFSEMIEPEKAAKQIRENLLARFKVERFSDLPIDQIKRATATARNMKVSR